jgi:hypothetical protein
MTGKEGRLRMQNMGRKEAKYGKEKDEKRLIRKIKGGCHK